MDYLARCLILIALHRLVLCCSLVKAQRPRRVNPPMRLLLTAAGAFLISVSCAVDSTDFAGEWVLDLPASASPDPMLPMQLRCNRNV
jgi:hypothetical protein